jgi:hypothetical protein
MDITPRPQLVINLLPSMWRQDGPAGSLLRDDRETREMLIELNRYGELGKEELDQAHLNVMLFLQRCVLPVAIQTNALVLMHSSECVLAKAFSELCAAQQEKMGGQLPFTTLCVFRGIGMEGPSTTPGTVAQALRQKSRRWKEQANKCRMAAEDHEPQHVYHEQMDLPIGCTHYIIVDCVTLGHGDSGPRDLFKNSFTQRLAEELPSLGVATMFSRSRTYSLRQYDDYVGRELPLLVLDTRARIIPYPCDFKAAEAELSDMEQALEATGTVNIHLNSMLGYVHIVLERVHDKKRNSGQAGLAQAGLVQHISIQDCDTDGDGVLTLDELSQAAHVLQGPERRLERAWIWDKVRRMKSELRHSGGDELNNKETLAMEASRMLEKAFCAGQAAEPKMEAVMHRKRAQAVAELENSKEALALYLTDMSTVLINIRRSKLIKQLADLFPDRLQLRQTFKEGKHWMEVLALTDRCTDADVVALKQQISDIVSSWADDCDQMHARRLDETFTREDLMAAYNVLLSPHMYSCHITNTRRISNYIAEVAKIDRLPAENSPEAMEIILAAWDHVDIFMGMARWCKVVAKVMYALLLLTGMSTVIVITITLMGQDSACDTACEYLADCGNGDAVATCKAETCETVPGYISETITDEQSRFIVLALSVAASLLASTAAYLNPAQRWQQLRGAALSLESELWKFRTRAGPYTVAGKMTIGRFSRDSARRLLEFQTSLVQQVSKSAAIADTTLHSQYELFGQPSKRELARFKHGQYEGADTHGTFGAANTVRGGDIDDHHSPLHAPEYLQFRVKPIVDFYKGRLPRYYFSRTISQYLLLLGTFASMILAFLDIAAWAAAPTAVAWSEFSGTDKKLNRYSGTIEALTHITVWWKQLSSVEQANVANLHKMILSCEEVLEREREAWLSTSMATKMLAAAGGAEPEEKHAADKEK